MSRVKVTFCLNRLGSYFPAEYIFDNVTSHHAEHNSLERVALEHPNHTIVDYRVEEVRSYTR